MLLSLESSDSLPSCRSSPLGGSGRRRAAAAGARVAGVDTQLFTTGKPRPGWGGAASSSLLSMVPAAGRFGARAQPPREAARRPHRRCARTRGRRSGKGAGGGAAAGCGPGARDASPASRRVRAPGLCAPPKPLPAPVIRANATPRAQGRDTPRRRQSQPSFAVRIPETPTAPRRGRRGERNVRAQRPERARDAAQPGTAQPATRARGPRLRVPGAPNGKDSFARRSRPSGRARVPFAASATSLARSWPDRAGATFRQRCTPCAGELHAALALLRDPRTQMAAVRSTASAATAAAVRAMSTSAAGARKLIFFGAPGVGKGTFASRIGPELGIPAISTGDIIRAEVKAGSDVGKEVKVSRCAARQAGMRRGSPPPRCAVRSATPRQMRARLVRDRPARSPAQAFSESGKLVPDELVDKMVKRRLAEPDAQNGYILVRRRTAARAGSAPPLPFAAAAPGRPRRGQAAGAADARAPAGSPLAARRPPTGHRRACKSFADPCSI